MAGQEYGAAQGIVDWAKKAVSPLAKVGQADKPVESSSKKDTSWHDEMVRKANEGFAKQQVGKKPVQKSKKTLKKSSAKKMARKKAY